ncbi:MAG TPA: integrase arm-type DNA-binding domain-containing protein [Thermoanaerobaculia bacterium]|nr:integrase arm-type DNA-binding domain-containing protein [Thermoanaerobaculia bacterium]
MRVKLTKGVVESARANQSGDRLLWDIVLPGFGLRVTRAGVKSYIVQYRAADGRDRRLTLGKEGAMTLEQARRLAAEKHLQVRAGRDPALEREAALAAPTVAELVARFMTEHAPRRSKSTQEHYKIFFRCYLLPALGGRKVRDVRWEDLDAIHRSLSSTPYAANRFLSACSKAWALAARWGWWPREMPNPAREHDRYPEMQRGQALDPGALGRLGKGLLAELPGSLQVAAFTFTLFTGCRPGEALAARWADLEGRCLHLPDSKTGPRTVYVGAAAADLLDGLERISDFVFPGRFGSLYDLRPLWLRLRVRAQLSPRLRLYDATRHTFNSTAARLGVPREIRMRLMGHAPSREVHDVYTHYAPEYLLRAADLVAKELAALTRGEQEGLRQWNVGPDYRR